VISVWRSVAHRLERAFFRFVQDFDECDSYFPVDWEALSDYIAAWLEFGNAIDVCKADWHSFMQGVERIVTAYEREPSLINYHPRDWRTRRRRTVDRIYEDEGLDPHSSYFRYEDHWESVLAERRKRRR
jgi:hypothetical protein